MNISKKLVPSLYCAITFLSTLLCIPRQQHMLLYGQTYHSTGRITGVETWHAGDNPHIVTGDISIYRTFEEPYTPELVIEPGCVVKFNPGTSIIIGGFDYFFVDEGGFWQAYPMEGSINASGTINNPILFTSNQPNPAPGDWGRIYLSHLNAAGVFHYCQLEYGTDGLFCDDGASPSIENSTIRNFGNYGVYTSGVGYGPPSITCSDIKNNVYGVYVYGGSNPVITNCNITGNTSYGVYNGGSLTVIAKNNWWGAASGPYHPVTNPGGTGDRVDSFVDYTPFLTSPHTCSATAVEMVFFKAAAGDDRAVTMTWETATEVDNAGFNIYRSRLRDGEYKKINDTFIPAKGDATSGAKYNFEDTPPAKGTYYYKLADVDTHDVSTMHETEKVRVRK